MISSIFNKTKPINFIILMVFLLVFYSTVQFYYLDWTFKELDLGVTLSGLLILLFTIFVVDFVVKRNKLTKTNSLAILYYTLLFVLFPETLRDSNAIFANLFVLLGLRRLLSIKSLKGIKSKIFDAGLFICISSLFYEWALLYLVLVFAAIYIYQPRNIRNWLVLFIVGFVFFMILLAFLIVTNNTDFLKQHYTFGVNIAQLNLSNWLSSVKIILFVVLNIILAFLTFIVIRKVGMGKMVIMRVVVLSFMIGLFINLLVSSSNTSVILFTFFPSAVLIVNYLESIKKSKILELILVSSIVIPLLLFISKL